MKVLFKSIGEYITSFPENIQIILQKIHQTVREAVPEAVESISYGMPAFKLKNKPLVYFAAFTHHIGFYPTPSPLSAFEEKMKSYKTSKGAVQFPLDKPIPYDLIREITLFRAKQIEEQ